MKTKGHCVDRRLNTRDIVTLLVCCMSPFVCVMSYSDYNV